ncbi:MAG: hypothetical protein ILNGONEN_00426 [Syntrophorhabdaceae bacterium]|nr:hypothetical protein [Syntrophorhabdaceae bacterium]
MHKPIPARVAIAEFSFILKAAIGHHHQVRRRRNADPHAVDFIRLLIFVRPPQARARALAGRVNPRIPQRVLLERNAAETPGFLRMPGIMKIDAVSLAGFQPFGKIDKHGVELACVLQRLAVEQNAVDLHVVKQIDLNALIIREHFKPDRVESGKIFLCYAQAHVEIIKQQIIVGAIWPVAAAQRIPAIERQFLLDGIDPRRVKLEQQGRGALERQVHFHRLVILRANAERGFFEFFRNYHAALHIRAQGIRVIFDINPCTFDGGFTGGVDEMNDDVLLGITRKNQEKETTNNQKMVVEFDSHIKTFYFLVWGKLNTNAS